MTTTITVKSHNYPARVRVLDQVGDGQFNVASEEILTPEDGTREYYCTTTRRIEVQDVEYAEVEAAKAG